MKNKPIFENFFTWRGLPALITVIGIILGVIFAYTDLTARIGAIEKDHMVFGEQYKSQVQDIKDGQLRLEGKIDRIYDRFFQP